MANVHLAVRGMTHPVGNIGPGVKKDLKRKAWKRYRAAVRDALRKGFDPDFSLPQPMSVKDVD